MEDPYLSQLKAWAKKALPGKARLRPLKKKKKKRKNRFSGRPAPRRDIYGDLPFPCHVRYVFGRGTIEVREPSWKAWKPRTKTEKQFKAKLALQEEVKEFRALLLGYPPYLDRSLAALLRDLDQDRSIDRLAHFLETYNKESMDFYEAMDSSSRAGESLFYFDAMISAWIRYCFQNQPDLQKDLRKKNMAELRSILFRSFGSYRRYRGLREAVALSLVLRPQDPFPESLLRYDPKDPGDEYFTRAECLMLLALKEFRIPSFLTDLKSSLPPLRVPLFAHENRQIQAVNARFEKASQGILAQARSTEAFFQQAKKRLEGSFAEVAARVAKALGPKGTALSTALGTDKRR
ncbi:MAG TPA: hypothetical protein ENK02_06815 [Planctomycetes bacterium]|nr:hypothetical protein [Planctomycetota bacterium]